ncbi:DUF799 domain-containing protein [Paucibacter sp. M5-1]|uniref:DUF799 domain-containing protein n=1 Tax=Paucibacter sp. M5-1 TaxID=3015998 RepID=UPI003F7CD7A3
MKKTYELLRRLLAVVGLAALTACATQTKPYDYTALKEAKPASLLILPPLNDSPDVAATYSVYSQLTQPLAESGYYVLPVSLVDETLRANGVVNPAEAQSIEPAKLRQIFGADAALYVVVKRYGSVYKVVSSDATVEVEAKLVSLKTGQQLWDGKAVASTAEQNNSNQGGLVGMLVKAVIDQVANNLTERSHGVAAIAGQRLLTAGTPNGLLHGPRAPAAAKN